MEQNWTLKEAMKSRKSRDVVILERPDVKRYLNGLLIKRFWPVIQSSLEASGYVYFPEVKKGKQQTEKAGFNCQDRGRDKGKECRQTASTSSRTSRGCSQYQ